jgi:phosphate transport system substrate-binding protein
MRAGAALQAVAGLLVVVLAASCGREATGTATTDCELPPRRPTGLWVAGSGSNVAVAREIARRFRDVAGASVHVPESIGTSGGLQALADRAIDAALASRPLTDEEKRSGFVEHVFARVPVVPVTHPDVSVSAVSMADLMAIFRGERDRWPDGTPIVPLLREPGDSGNELLARTLPALWGVIGAAMAEDRFTICYTDREMADTLAVTPGAIGFLDVGTARLTHPQLRLLTIDDGPPAPRSTSDDSLSKVLSFVTFGPPTGDAERFIRFATSRETTELLVAAGYLPPNRD